MNSSPVCLGGRGAFGWYKLELTGKKSNGQTVTALDCSDMDANGCIQLQAKIKFDDEDLKKYYNEESARKHMQKHYDALLRYNKKFSRLPIK